MVRVALAAVPSQRNLKVFLFIYEITGAPFKKLASLRDDWALNNRYVSPGML